MPRQGDLDGRGNLSRRALAEFTAWFLKVCLNQVTFLTGLFALEHSSIAFASAERRTWRPEAWLLLERVLQQGEVPRGDAAPTTGLRERSARDLAKSRPVSGGLPCPSKQQVFSRWQSVCLIAPSIGPGPISPLPPTRFCRAS